MLDSKMSVQHDKTYPLSTAPFMFNENYSPFTPPEGIRYCFIKRLFTFVFIKLPVKSIDFLYYNSNRLNPFIQQIHFAPDKQQCQCENEKYDYPDYCNYFHGQISGRPINIFTVIIYSAISVIKPW